MKDTLSRYIAVDLLNQPGLAIADDENLLATGVLDSLRVMSLVQFAEQTFGVEIPAEDVTIENFASLTTIERYLRQRRA